MGVTGWEVETGLRGTAGPLAAGLTGGFLPKSEKATLTD
jgi:hypothetical protein